MPLASNTSPQEVRIAIQAVIHLAVEADLMDCAVKLKEALESAGGPDPAGRRVPSVVRQKGAAGLSGSA